MNCPHCGGIHYGSLRCPYLDSDPGGFIAKYQKEKEMTAKTEMEVPDQGKITLVGSDTTGVSIVFGMQPKDGSCSVAFHLTVEQTKELIMNLNNVLGIKSWSHDG